MAFVVPQFNLSANVWHNKGAVPFIPSIGSLGTPDLTSACQIRFDPGHAISVSGTFSGLNSTNVRPTYPTEIRFPKLTDVRGYASAFLSGNTADVIEAPAGSGRYYFAEAVEDVGKGFANEYRQVVAFPVSAPTPLP